MHILLLAQHYAPEDVSGAALGTELTADLIKNGHQVTFITCAPNYPQGQVFPGYRNRLYQVEMLHGVRVIRVWSYISPNKSVWSRTMNYGTFSLAALPGGLFADKPDLVFSWSPPLPLGISAWILSRIWHIPWALRVEDLYPDAAIAAGILRQGSIVRSLKRLETFLYARADHISLISEGFRRNLLAKGVSDRKLSVTPVWADPDVVRPMDKDNEFRRQQKLSGKFVIMYAGTLGYNTALEDVLDAADLLRDEDSLRFVIVGEGVKKPALAELILRRNLHNVQLLPFQPREAYGEMMAAADVSLVTLNDRSFGFSLPSKTFNIMASARPILAVSPVESEIAQLVIEGGCGVTVPPGQPTALAEQILLLRNRPDLLETMGRNGRSLLETRYSRARCVEAMTRTMTEAVYNHRRPS